MGPLPLYTVDQELQNFEIYCLCVEKYHTNLPCTSWVLICMFSSRSKYTKKYQSRPCPTKSGNSVSFEWIMRGINKYTFFTSGWYIFIQNYLLWALIQETILLSERNHAYCYWSIVDRSVMNWNVRKGWGYFRSVLLGLVLLLLCQRKFNKVHYSRNIFA